MMHATTFDILSGTLITLVVGVAMFTDLRSRRIPNTLTFSAFGAAVLARVLLQGWTGLGLALTGALVAPLVLLIIHMGRGLGMGDLKLAAAIGAFMGPAMAVAAMLLSAVLGGLLAIALLMRRGQLLSDFLRLFMIGTPFLKNKQTVAAPASEPDTAAITMPYGVAIGVGSLVTLAVYTWLGI